MKQDLNVLIDYLTCTDAVMVTKWQNILASFWHKDDGQLITSIASTENIITITTVDGDGTTTDTRIEQYQEPENFEISKITGLALALEAKVSAEVGKGLSQQNFTTAYLTKLEALTNYNPPNNQEIAYINGLLEALNNLQANINSVSDSIGQGNPIVLYFLGYRLYKDQGNTETYPQTGEELRGRGDGSLFGGEILHITAINDVPIAANASEADFNLINSEP
jgi:hypothetical protein